MVEVSKTDYTFSPDKFTVAGKDTNLVFQGTKTSYTISGVIRDVYGNALSDVPVEITNGSALWKVHAFTDSSGHFSVSGLTGALLVKPNMPNLKFEPESETVDGIDSIMYFLHGSSAQSGGPLIEQPANCGCVCYVRRR